ncbi:MAG: hypothetical protein LBS86_02645 [Treponema sp.]|nr:hypothetical protein [Treponema sp.]
MNKELPSIVRLIRFICLAFVITIVIFTLVNFLALKVEALLVLWLLQSSVDTFASEVCKSLPPVMYIIVLLSLSYSVRRGLNIPLSIICVGTISLLWVALFTVLLGPTTKVMDVFSNNTPFYLGERGVIMHEADDAFVVLGGLSDPTSGRVLIEKNIPLQYQDSVNSISGASFAHGEGLVTPSIFFRHDSIHFLGWILSDFTRMGQEFSVRLDESFLSFYLYVASIVFCLCSLCFVFTLSSWPLANIFLGAVLFLGVLRLGVLFEHSEVQAFFLSFWVEDIPVSLLEPALFCALGLLFLLATLLVSVTRKRRHYEN